MNDSNEVLTRVTCPKLAALRPKISPNSLVLQKNNKKPLKVTQEEDTQQAFRYTYGITIAYTRSYNGKTGTGFVCCDEANVWISEALGISGCKLVRLPKDMRGSDLVWGLSGVHQGSSILIGLSAVYESGIDG